MTTDRLLLVTHVAIRKIDGNYYIDDQTCKGLVRWCENFEQTTYAGIELNDDSVQNFASAQWQSVAELPCASRLDIIALPRAYGVGQFVSQYSRTRALLAAEIARSRYLCFTLGCLVGDWAALAAVEARKQGRPYGVWLDRIEHEVIRSDLATMPFARRMKETVSLPMIERYHRSLIQDSSIGLLQGMDCYEHYRRYTDKGFCVYDTHTTPADFIDAEALRAKIQRALSGDPLRICYVGRAVDMKGPLDWLSALAKARDSGVKFKATWVGDGPQLESMRNAVTALQLDDRVELPGFVSDKAEILSHMAAADIFLFCHKTPESPRCLIESLVCGSPLVGYGSAYARGLVDQHGGGAFISTGDIDSLAAQLVALDRDRAGLAGLIEAAARSGLRFDEQTVYSHRAGLIRQSVEAAQ